MGLERMRIDLQSKGYDVKFVIINMATALAYVDEFLTRTAMPVFQDLPTVNAFVLTEAKKDDYLIYGSDGNLAVHLPYEPALSLSTEEGYEAVRDTVLSVD